MGTLTHHNCYTFTNNEHLITLFLFFCFLGEAGYGGAQWTLLQRSENPRFPLRSGALRSARSLGLNDHQWFAERSPGLSDQLRFLDERADTAGFSLRKTRGK
jgi:hypothetical protein